MTHIHTIARQLALHRPWQPRPSAGEDHFNLTAPKLLPKTSQNSQIEAGKASPLHENREFPLSQTYLYAFVVRLLSCKTLLWETETKHHFNAIFIQVLETNEGVLTDLHYKWKHCG